MDDIDSLEKEIRRLQAQVKAAKTKKKSKEKKPKKKKPSKATPLSIQEAQLKESIAKLESELCDIDPNTVDELDIEDSKLDQEIARVERELQSAGVVTDSMARSAKTTARVGNKRDREEFCTCRKPDDGRPMIMCEKCQEWFHHACVNLTREEESCIERYFCQSCTKKSSRIAIVYKTLSKIEREVSLLPEYEVDLQIYNVQNTLARLQASLKSIRQKQLQAEDIIADRDKSLIASVKSAMHIHSLSVSDTALQAQIPGGQGVLSPYLYLQPLPKSHIPLLALESCLRQWLIGLPDSESSSW